MDLHTAVVVTQRRLIDFSNIARSQHIDPTLLFAGAATMDRWMRSKFEPTEWKTFASSLFGSADKLNEKIIDDLDMDTLVEIIFQFNDVFFALSNDFVSADVPWLDGLTKERRAAFSDGYHDRVKRIPETRATDAVSGLEPALKELAEHVKTHFGTTGERSRDPRDVTVDLDSPPSPQSDWQ